MDQEIWKSIEGYEGLYEVSNKGRVRSLTRVVHYCSKHHSDYDRLLESKILKPNADMKHKFPYYTVALSKGSDVKYVLVHRLVAQAFLPNPTDLPVVNHIDSNTLNNCVENLEWCTQQHNVQWGYTSGSHVVDPEHLEKLFDSIRKRVYCPELDKEYPSHAAAMNELGLHADYVTSSTRSKGRKSDKYYEVQHKYTVINVEDKEDYKNYIEYENSITRPLFSYGRKAVDLKSGKVFCSRTELSETLHIPDASCSVNAMNEFNGYLPKYDVYLYDIGYRNECHLTSEEQQSVIKDMKINFVKKACHFLIRCSTNGKAYRSGTAAETDLGLPHGSVSERLAFYNGNYSKYNLHFYKISADDLSEEEALAIAEEMSYIFINCKKGGRRTK